jgi:hypothetical protein
MARAGTDRRAVGFMLLATALVLGASTAHAKKPEKPKKPKLSLTIIPRMAMAPVDVLLVARLEGGDELKELYCPEIEIEWDDGSSSDQEPECPPFEPGVTKIERRYSASHTFRRSGLYNIQLRLSHEGRNVLSERVELHVGPGLGE